MASNACPKCGTAYAFSTTCYSQECADQDAVVKDREATDEGWTSDTTFSRWKTYYLPADNSHPAAWEEALSNLQNVIDVVYERHGNVAAEGADTWWVVPLIPVSPSKSASLVLSEISAQYRRRGGIGTPQILNCQYVNSQRCLEVKFRCA